MVVCKRRKTCFVGSSSPFTTIPEDADTEEGGSGSGRRDSLESSSSGGSTELSGRVQWPPRSPDQDLLQGEWTLISNNNYDKFLAAVGAGPLSSNMVLRARINMTIKEELDKQWRISYETIIRAKSIRGYNTRAAKVTENKFQLDVERPELLDDWDQRWVMSTLTRDNATNRMTIAQVAEKEQRFCQDSTVILEVDEVDPDLLTMTCIIGDIIAWRKFRRIVRKAPPVLIDNEKKAHRKFSCPL